MKITPLTFGQSGYDPFAFKHPNSRIQKYGPLLFDDNFNGHTCGWADHAGYDWAQSQVGLTTRYPLHGTHSLTLQPSDGASGTATNHNGVGSYRRLATPNPDGVMTLKVWFAISGHGDKNEKKFPFGDVWFGVDHQTQSNGTRIFAQVQLRDEGDGNVAWYLRTGKAGSGSTQPWRDPQVFKIPGSENQFMGMNEGKVNIIPASLTLNYGSLIAGGHFFEEFQVGDWMANLKPLGAPTPYDLLLNNGSWDTFTSGLNAGFGGSRSTINPSYRNVRFHLAKAAMSFGDTIGA